MLCKEISVSHLDGEYGVIACIKKDLCNIANSFINIGFRLHEADRYKYYEEKGYDSVYEMAEKELEMKKSVVSRYMNIYERFHCREAGQARLMDIAPKYAKFNYSQLCEILPLSDYQIKRMGINADMTVAEIRQIKRNYCLKPARKDVQEECCDVATEAKIEIDTEEHEPVDVEYVEVKKKKPVDEIMSFIDFYNSSGLDFFSNLEKTILNNTKKEAVKLVHEMIVLNDELYRKYLREELK